MRMLKARGMKAQPEQLLLGDLGATEQEGRGRPAVIPFEEKAVGHTVRDDLLAVLAPGERGEERAGCNRAAEPDRRRQAGDVVRLVPLGLMQMTARELRRPGTAIPADARGPRIEPQFVDVLA